VAGEQQANDGVDDQQSEVHDSPWWSCRQSIDSMVLMAGWSVVGLGADPATTATEVGERITVEHWSGAHIATLVATAFGAALLVVCARRRGQGWALWVGRALALVILGGFVCEQVTYALRGQWTVQFSLPLHLTDAVTFASIAALWRPDRALLVELVYFWALSASVQAVLTPSVSEPFPDLLAFSYFATHSGAVMAACLLMFGARRRPRPGAVWRVYALTAAFTAIAAVGTVATGGNYMWLRRKPVRGSLLDVMGPWPVYILTGAALGLAMFAVLDLLARRISPPETAAIGASEQPAQR
jgi:hypothetical integral membrane protein (TIGR02206 family)